MHAGYEERHSCLPMSSRSPLTRSPLTPILRCMVHTKLLSISCMVLSYRVAQLHGRCTLQGSSNSAPSCTSVGPRHHDMSTRACCAISLTECCTLQPQKCTYLKQFWSRACWYFPKPQGTTSPSFVRGMECRSMATSLRQAS